LRGSWPAIGGSTGVTIAAGSMTRARSTSILVPAVLVVFTKTNPNWWLTIAISGLPSGFDGDAPASERYLDVATSSRPVGLSASVTAAAGAGR
jgi:hypothetical protein